MTYTAKPLSCDPTKLRGLSEKLILSHWENNYGGAVRRPNAIAAQLTELGFARAPVFVINGLKREELIATRHGEGAPRWSGLGPAELLTSRSDLMNQWAADHTHALAGGTPILALDMYEHSYQLDHGASAERYVDAFMENINWAHVARLHQAHTSSEPESELQVWRAIR